MVFLVRIKRQKSCDTVLLSEAVHAVKHLKEIEIFLSTHINHRSTANRNHPIIYFLEITSNEHSANAITPKFVAQAWPLSLQ